MKHETQLWPGTRWVEVRETAEDRCHGTQGMKWEARSGPDTRRITWQIEIAKSEYFAVPYLVL